jgi:hypothetical protein
MTDQTKTCSACQKVLPTWHFTKRGSSKDGLQSKCKPCFTANENELIAKRQATMTDEEYSTKREAKLARKRAYNEANREDLNRKKRLTKLRRRVPALVKELSLMARGLKACTPEWKHWAKETSSAKHQEHQVYKNVMGRPEIDKAARQRFRNDPVMKEIQEIQSLYSGPPYFLYPRDFNKRIDEITALLDTFDGKEMHEALTYVPMSRDRDAETLSPSTLRFIEKTFPVEPRVRDEADRECLVVDLLAAAEESMWQDGIDITNHYPDGSTKTRTYYPESNGVEIPAEKERRLIAESQGIIIEPRYERADSPRMDGLAVMVADRDIEKTVVEERRLEKNRKQRERRANAKISDEKLAERRAYKAEKERERRARIKAEKQQSVDNPVS